MGLRQLAGRLLRWLEPWLWIPLFVAASLEWNFFDDSGPVALLVLLPLSALIGRRFGRRGLLIVAVGGIPLVLGLGVREVVGAPSLDVVLAALFVCWLAGRPEGWFDAAVARGRSLSLPALLLLGPLGIDIAFLRSGGYSLRIGLTLECLLYLGLFLMGLARRPAAKVLPALALVALAGVLMEVARLPSDARDLVGGPRAELPGLGLTDLSSLRVRDDFDSPSAFMAAVACFLAGGFVSRAMTGRRMPRPSWLLVAGVIGLAFVTLGAEIELVVFGQREFAAHSHFSPFGSLFALPLAALLGGMVFGRGGIVELLLLVFATWVLAGWIAAGGDPDAFDIEVLVHQPLNVVSFGVLGLALRDAVLGTRTVWWSLRWTRRTLLLALGIVLMLKPDAAIEFAQAIAVAIVAALLAGAIARLSLRFLGPTAGSHHGWWALAVLLMVIGLSWTASAPARIQRDSDDIGFEASTPPASLTGQLEQAFRGLQDEASDGHCPLGVIVEDERWHAIGLALLLLWSALHLLSQLLPALPLMAQEVRYCFRALRELLGGRWPSARAIPAETQASALASGFRWCAARLGTAARWGRNAVLALGVVAAIALAGYAAHDDWREGRRDAAEDEERWRWPSGVEEEDEPLADEASEDAASGAVASRDAAKRRPPPEPEVIVNPFLWRAAQEVLAQWPIEEQRPADGWIATGWRTDPGPTQDRSRVTCRVGEQLEASDVDVELLRERLWHFGLWVERADYYSSREQAMVRDDSSDEQPALRDRILARARELAAAGAAGIGEAEPERRR